jgi:hypothetical protein
MRSDVEEAESSESMKTETCTLMVRTVGVAWRPSVSCEVNT